MPKKEEEKVLGLVTEALPNASFRVKLDNDQEIIAYLSGKMRLHRIKVLIGDKVEIVTDSPVTKGRIVKRL